MWGEDGTMDILYHTLADFRLQVRFYLDFNQAGLYLSHFFLTTVILCKYEYYGRSLEN
jgi:hypothetical protein